VILFVIRLHSYAVHRPFAGCSARPHPDHVLHGLPGGGCQSLADHAIAGYPKAIACTLLSTPTLRGLQCEDTPGPRIIRATRRQMQPHPDHAEAGYPEAVSPRTTSPCPHQLLARKKVPKGAGYPTTAPHTRTTLMRATRRWAQTDQPMHEAPARLPACGL